MKNKFNFKNILVITKKEISGFLDNPSFYVVLVVFLLLWFFLFFRSAFLIGETSLTGLFEIFPWFGLVFISAVTMGSIAKEKDDGTLELVLTHPVREIDFVIGKILASFAFVFFTLLYTIPIAVIFSRYGAFDWGVYASQLMGALLFSLALISIGVFLSSLFNSQIASLLSTLGIGFLLIVSGTDLVTVAVPQALITIFTGISLYSHYSAVIRGAIDLYDVLYFILVFVIFAVLTLLQLYKRKYGDYKARYSILQFLAIGTVAIIFVSAVVKFWIPFRFDATQNRIFTLSDKTKVLIKNIPETVVITVYKSDHLPSQYEPISRDLKYILGNYKSIAGSKIEISYIDPSKSPEQEQKAYEEGVQKIQFNVIGKEELQLKSGYLGLVVKSNENIQSIPFVSSTADLEYQLTSLIRQVTIKDKKTLAFLSGHDEKTTVEYGYFAAELFKQFNITTVTLDEDDPQIEANSDLLIIAAPKKAYSEKSLQAIKDYLAKGKDLVVFYDAYDVSDTLTTAQNAGNLDALLADYGVTLSKDIGYDLQSFSRISFNTGFQTVAAPYPYWVVVPLDDNNPLGLKYVQAATLFWPSTLTTVDDKLKEKGYTKSEILTTTDNAGSVEGIANVYPMDQAPAGKIGKKVLGIILTPEPKTDEGLTQNGRILVIGDSDFISDRLLPRSPQNMAFAVGAMSWAADVESFADIQVKGLAFGTFKFKTETEPSKIRLLVLAIPIVISAVMGLARITRRRTLRYRIVKV